METKQTAPNAIASLVLGISSLVFGCFFIGVILGIIGLVLGNKGLAEYNNSPEKYDGEGMLKAGRICSIIGIVLGGIYVLYYIIAVAIIGSSALSFMSMFN